MRQRLGPRLGIESEETWATIQGFQDSYEVSSLGRVRSLPRISVFNGRWGAVSRKQSGKILKQMKHTGGYLTVTLWRQGVSKICLVHKLVLEAFVSARPSGMQVAHGDGNRKNNALYNLRWASPKENQADRELHGTGRLGKKSYVKNRFNVKQIKAIRKHYEVHGENISATAKKFNLPRTTVADIVTRRTWKEVA